MLPHMRQSWETMNSASAGHIILTSTQPVGSGNLTHDPLPFLTDFVDLELGLIIRASQHCRIIGEVVRF